MVDNPNMLEVNALFNPHDRLYNFNLNDVDFEWVERTNDKRELRAAYNALKVHNQYPQLLDAVIKKLREAEKQDTEEVMGFLRNLVNRREGGENATSEPIWSDEPTATRPKIVEINPATFKKINIKEDDSEDSDDGPAPTAQS